MSAQSYIHLFAGQLARPSYLQEPIGCVRLDKSTLAIALAEQLIVSGHNWELQIDWISMRAVCMRKRESKRELPIGQRAGNLLRLQTPVSWGDLCEQDSQQLAQPLFGRMF